MLEARVGNLEAALARLAEAEARADTRIAELAEAQRRTDEQLGRLTERVDQLAERVDQLADAQRRTEARVAELAEAQRRTETRVDQLAERVDQLADAQRRTEARLEELIAAVRRLTERLDYQTTVVGDMRGQLLEIRYFNRAPSYFAEIVRRAHALSSEELAALLDEAQERGAVDDAGWRELLRTDVVVRGRQRSSGEPGYLAVEVSAVVDEDDVWRAVRRAELLGRATGVAALPVVAGERIVDAAEEVARSRGVWRVLDGRAAAP